MTSGSRDNREKKCKCDTCGAQFAHNCKLKNHNRTHIGEKPYKCDTCGAQFAENGKLKRHIGTHTRENLLNVI